MSTGHGLRIGIATPGYRWYTASQALSIVGTMMSYTALYWLSLHVAHGNAVLLSAVVACQFLPLLLFSRRAGTIMSRHRAARVLIVTQLAQSVGALALGIPLLVGWTAAWYLLALSFITGSVQAVDVPARQTFMLDLVGEAELRRGSSIYASVTGLSKIAGPGLAGVIIAVSGEAAVFLLDGASFLVVVGVLIWLRESIGGPLGPVDSNHGYARRFHWVLDLPRRIQIAAGMALLIGGFGIQFEVTNPLMATRTFHLSSLGFGLLGTCMAVGGIGGSYYSSRRPDPSHSEFLLWAAIFGLVEALGALMPTAWTYDIAMILVGAAIQLFAVSSTVYVQKNAPASQRGHALSAYNAAFMGFVPAGSFAVAGIAAITGPRWALIGPGLIIAVCAVAVQVSNVAKPGMVTSAGTRQDQAALTIRPDDPSVSADADSGSIRLSETQLRRRA